MKNLLMVALLVIGCDNSIEIRACGETCHNGGTKMVKWSPTDGCLCEGAVQSAAREDAK